MAAVSYCVVPIDKFSFGWNLKGTEHHQEGD